MLLKARQASKVLPKTISYRQGDVLVVKIEHLPEGAKRWSARSVSFSRLAR